MTAVTIAPITVAQLHAGFGCCNLASVECPGNWRARAAELLSESHGPVAETIVARVVALTALLSAGPNPWAYTKHEAHNVTPALFAAAAVCDLNERGLFDRAEIERHCGRGAEATA